MGIQPSELEPIRQTGVKVFPTRTIYNFQNTLVALEMIFTTPALVSDPDVLSRPVTYITWNIRAVDGKAHSVQLYFDCGAEIAVDTPDQTVQWSLLGIKGLKAIGNFEVFISWKESQLENLTVKSNNGGICHLTYAGQKVEYATKVGETLKLDRSLRKINR